MEEFPGGIKVHDDNVDIAAIESVATNWTDEKHKSYLNSIEASFVKKHNSRCNSDELFNWLSRTPLHSTSALSGPKIQSIDSVTEVSDQNFVDTEEVFDKRVRKKRARSTIFSLTDKVVPFMSSEQKEEKKDECSKRKIFETYEI